MIELTNDMRIHMSKTAFKLERRPIIQNALFKPNGFWYGFGSDWIDWCRGEMPHWIGQYIYRVDIGNSNVLRIHTGHDLIQFNQKYGCKYHDIDGFIDWKKVSSQYDGIEINPYQTPFRYKYSWYYSWDVSSGCIWNLDGVKLELLTDNHT